jgi:hypothetical protein
MSPAPPHDPSDASRLPDRLRDALLAAEADARESSRALREAVCDYVDDGRRRGKTLDQMATAVTGVVARLRRTGAIPAARRGRDDLLEQILAWCAESGGS